MKVFDAAAVRNVALVGHSGSGKTQLASALLFDAGAVNRLGKVDEGTTVTDYDEEAIARKHTLSASLAYLEWNKCKVNLIDSPGMGNFLSEARAATPAMPMEAAAFVKAMDATGPWQAVPILIGYSFPAGPIEQATFERALTIMLEGLDAALPLDAVYVCNHGAMTATHTFDPDGEIVSRVREVIGPKARLVMTLDLHANISERMVAPSDMVVGYLTSGRAPS